MMMTMVIDLADVGKTRLVLQEICWVRNEDGGDGGRSAATFTFCADLGDRMCVHG